MLNKKVRIILIILFSVTFLASSAMLIFTIADREKAKADFDELAELVVIPKDELPTESDTTASQPNATTQPNPQPQPTNPTPAITRNISLLKEMNSECIGWVYIKGTNVNYPVMHSPLEPEKYLKKNFYGQYSGSGVPFIDSRCDLKSANIIIYGHNMKNLTMFGGLRKYLENGYLKSHPTIEFETTKGLVYYNIIEVRKTDIYDNWFTHNLDGKKDGKEYLTLSTCYGSNKKARLLIIAQKQTNE